MQHDFSIQTANIMNKNVTNYSILVVDIEMVEVYAVNVVSDKDANAIKNYQNLINYRVALDI